MFRVSLLEFFFMELVIWLGLWLMNDYIATLLTLIVTAIVSAVLLIALISELMERSKVPKKYFQIMALSIVAPLISAALYMILFGGNLDFLGRF
jgi:hypothetical protein